MSTDLVIFVLMTDTTNSFTSCLLPLAHACVVNGSGVISIRTCNLVGFAVWNFHTYIRVRVGDFSSVV